MARKPKLWLGLGSVLLIGGGVGLSRLGGSGGRSEEPYEPPSSLTESAPLCPWREPDADLAAYFPEANQREAVTLILSGRRLELAQALGRQPTADENALRLYRVFHDSNPAGVILVRRVKGAHGAIELVVAVTPEGVVRGVRLQQHREPPEAAATLGGVGWLDRFKGRRKAGPWEGREDFEDLPAVAQSSAHAIAEGIRSLLVLLAAAEPSSPADGHQRHP